MFLIRLCKSRNRRNMLRTSGDVSDMTEYNYFPTGYAPHERRCFLNVTLAPERALICSARAEMFLDVFTQEEGG